ncbi:MAG: NAD-dependent epimerase/dehydratase family protein, partial [Gaiellaceae bacterium]
MLKGKRILITGGAGFIATTLARRLVDANEIVAVDNMHRDALSGTPLADHPNFTLHHADVLDADRMQELAAGATHVVHCAAIAGVDTVLASPVRTMRVNVIG